MVHFIKRRIKLANKLKIHLIDKLVYCRVRFRSKISMATAIITFEEDQSIIRGFLGLAEFFNMVALKLKDKFYIPIDSALFRL